MTNTRLINFILFLFFNTSFLKVVGQPITKSKERLKLQNEKSLNTKINNNAVYFKNHTITLSFQGPETSENDTDNPFLNKRLIVDFVNKSTKKTIRGFYAADGKAAETSAKSGAIWQVRFTPDQIGEWTYSARLSKGKSIALNIDPVRGESIQITNATGKFVVVNSKKGYTGFASKGLLQADNGYFRFKESAKYWIKTGTNSPENFLAYEGFDDTYRIEVSESDGEATPTKSLHKYGPHIKDWNPGDPTWQNGKGKGIVGSVNYLASKGMNTLYFLTLNILGDGKDVWPYISPKDFTRFDVSKLDQWEIVFKHMQSKGILIHLVTQETENETMLDNGDTGPQRQLYYNELIARFGHHLGLVWNLGEENGPAHWSPVGQNDAQRKAMTKYLKENDPYNHPVLLHTHSDDKNRTPILNDIVGYKLLDGLSLQQHEPTETAQLVAELRQKAKDKGHEWLITMDEIGKWYNGAVTDKENYNHDTLAHYVLWGSLMSGAAGIEWYFGAKHPHNDLTSEDWRERNHLWELTNHARSFFQDYLPFWEMKPAHHLLSGNAAYCFQKENEIYAIYIPKNQPFNINLKGAKGEYGIQWYDPMNGGKLQKGSVEIIIGGDTRNLGTPPYKTNQDWVILLKRIVK